MQRSIRKCANASCCALGTRYADRRPPSRSNNRQFGSRYIKRIHIGCQPCISLLRSVGSVETVSNIPPAVSIVTHLMSVLILTVSTSYNFFRASLICLLFAFTSTMKTKVLFSSIFFIALSVLRGWMITLWASSRGSWGIDLRGYFGDLERTRVFGR